jgi:acetyl-CoA C-acetyltransferase
MVDHDLGAARPMSTALIVSTARTPLTKAWTGALNLTHAATIGAHAVGAALQRAGLDPAEVEDVVIGCANPEGANGQNIGRQIGMRAELPESVPGMTVSRFCASGLQAISVAAARIAAGECDVLVAGGVESISCVQNEMNTHMIADPWLAEHRPALYWPMLRTAENVAERYGVSREDQDRYAQRSQERAVAAQEAGVFDREIVPVTLADGTVVSKDDGPRASSTYEKLATLEPAFKPGGTVTAGNSCPLNDGAAAALIMSAEKAAELGLKPRARIITAATWGNEPEYMGVAPIGAIKKALDRAGMSASDIDITELNEAFAAQVLPIASEVGIDLDTLNPHGGAIALGHPFGMTGVRIMTTLLNDLETLDKTVGLETMCVAQGQGEAMIIERLN